MSEQLEERLRRAGRTYRRLGNRTAEGMFLESANVITELREDNAKLREFAREAYDTARGLALNDPLADVSWLADHMREMGIEV